MPEADNDNRVMEVFLAVAEADPDRRGELLEAACGSDVGLRGAVERLLEADGCAGEFLANAAWSPARQDVISDAGLGPVGLRVGSYEIVRYIASGGMADVYEALQERPRRTVALKLLRSSLASPTLLRRFQYEAELLARLRHPGIAQIYEAGTYENGPMRVPYLAMEYIPEALPLTRHASTHQLTPQRCLALFARVCEAVHHGHQRGVIHRDLKPSNILVDGAGEPRVIDFGVARALDGVATTQLTDIGQLIGTLAYMSPEQLRGDPAEVDVRSDVYALGVILYELLAGRPPYDLGRVGLAQAAQAIESWAPPPLGTVDRRFRGDVSHIVAAALHKDKDRRYQSAGDLAADIRRHLDGEAVTVRRPSVTYQVRKFAARHKALAFSALVSVAGLVAGGGLATRKAIEATRERNRAVQASERATFQAARAERINAFLGSVIGAADPRSHTADMTLRQALDEAAARVEVDLGDDLQVAADVHQMIGGIYYRFGRQDAAEKHTRRALEARRTLSGPRSCAVADTLIDLGCVVQSRDLAAGAALFAEALAIYREREGEESPKTASAILYLAGGKLNKHEAGEAEAGARRALAILERTGKANTGTAMLALRCIGDALILQGKTSEAEVCYRRALEVSRAALGPEHIEESFLLIRLARSLTESGRSEEAKKLEEQARSIQLKRFGPVAPVCDHPDSPPVGGSP